MSGVPKIEIAESVETLKSLMKQQKTAFFSCKSTEPVFTQNKCSRDS